MQYHDNQERVVSKESLRWCYKKQYMTQDMARYVIDACAQIEQCDIFMNARHVLAYEPICSLEIPCMESLQKTYSEKMWYVPEIVSSKEMLFIHTNRFVHSDEGSEPEHYRLTEHTCVVVPSLALGYHGDRLGKGGGYYDRFLAQYQQLVPYTVSVVPDFAVLSTTYVSEVHDVRVAFPLFARSCEL